MDYVGRMVNGTAGSVRGKAIPEHDGRDAEKATDQLSRYSQPRIQIRTYVVVLVVVLSSGSVFVGQLYYQYGVIALFLLALALCFPRSFAFPSLVVLILSSACLVGNFLIYQENPSGYIALMLKLVAVFCIVSTLDLYRAAHALVNTVTLLAILGFPFFVFGAFYPEYVRSHVSATTVWLNEYRITPFNVFGFWNMDRNQGIFWEPGAYAILLNVALAVLLLSPTRHSLHRNWMPVKLVVLSAALLSTQSTQGYIVAALIVCAYLCRPHATRPSGQLLVAMTALGLLALIGIGAGVVSDKFVAGNVSFDRRSYDTAANLELMLERPWAGWGFQNQEVLSTVYGVPDSSNSLLSLGYQFGLLVLIACVALQASALTRLLSGQLQRWFILAALVITYSTENMLLQPVFLAFLFWPGAADGSRRPTGDTVPKVSA